MSKKYLSTKTMVLFSFGFILLFSIESFSQRKPLSEVKVDSLKCSQEIEGLKLCIDSGPKNFKANEDIVLNLTWINSGDFTHRIVRAYDFHIIINNENNTLSPLSGDSFENDGITAEQKETIMKTIGCRGGRGLYLEASSSDTVKIDLGCYGFDLSAKDKYHVSLEKMVPNTENKTEMVFSLNDIVIEIK